MQPFLGPLLLGAAYFLLARGCLGLASVNASVSPVWPPSGLAVAALLGWGTRLWPGVFLGAFATNLAVSGSPASSLAIAAGNTLEAWYGARLTERFAGGARPRRRLRPGGQQLCPQARGFRAFFDGADDLLLAGRQRGSAARWE